MFARFGLLVPGVRGMLLYDEGLIQGPLQF